MSRSRSGLAVLTARAAVGLGVLLALGAVPAPAEAQETGTALKPDEIKSEPFKDAKTVGQIAKGQRVDILARQSGWLEIKANGKRGWVRLLSVRRGQAAGADASKEIGGVAGLATGRAGTGQVVSSTGVRGLSEGDLKNAKFDEAQVKRAEAMAVPAAQAKTFAAQGKLAAQQVAFLPDPNAGVRP
jgi:uncharacterized protein YgiM (DUF1202 family)